VAQRKAQAIAEVTQIVQVRMMALFDQTVDMDLDGIDIAVHASLRDAGGAMLKSLSRERVARIDEVPPECPNGHGPMERETRCRELVGVSGEFTYERGYHRCRTCGATAVPADDALGVGPGTLAPALSRVVSMFATQDTFGMSTRLVHEALQIELSEDEIYRTAGALGAVAEQEMAAAAGDPQPPTDPPPSSVLLVGADGTSTFTDGAWHEVKVGTVAALGPETRKVDPKTGREVLVTGEQRFCTLVGTADDFFPRLQALALQAGWQHPLTHLLLFLGDGSHWIWNRTGSFVRPGLTIVEILDIIHANQHIWDLANTVFGTGTLDAHQWAEPLTIRLKEEGPEPLLAALQQLRPKTEEGKEALRIETEYFKSNAAAGRMDYPTFIAKHFPIASGLVEAACNSVVCHRTKGAGKRWRRRGAQSILSLRCLLLTPSRWQAFFKGHPGLRRPPVATLRQETVA
jgi:hypothetical protein